jgi:hypothetical protein
MDDIRVEKILSDNYSKCYVKTMDPDELDNNVHLYINSHFYHGHSDMKIEHLRLVHSVLSEFFEKYKKAVDEEDFKAGEV